MSKLEFINETLKNAKINQLQLRAICRFFAYDYTASQTAGELGLSRQTINSYYKTIRSALIEDFDRLNEVLLNSELNTISFKLKYIKLKSYTIYYINLNNTLYLLDMDNKYFNKINSFIDNDLKDTLINHKRANCAKILFNSYHNEFFVASYSKYSNDLNDFINTRIRKFRGLNKNNINIHLKESLIRFNNNQNTLYKTLLRIFNI